MWVLGGPPLWKYREACGIFYARSIHVNNIRMSVLLVAGIVFLFSSCASRPVPRKFQAEHAVPGLSEDEAAITEAAENLLGRKPDSTVVINGKTFTLDCIGTVRAVFYSQGLDLARDFPAYSGNGVKRLYETLKAQNLLHKNTPRPGDLIFWNNTYDANDDGNLTNDPLTHAAVVLKVEDDGTIHYVHSHVRRGIITEVMNLRRPREYRDEAGKVINNALALGSGISRADNPPHWLSGDLWNSFGRVLTKKDYFAPDSRKL